MRSIKRWNMLMALTLVASGFTLRPTSAEAAAIYTCGTDSCGDDCDYTCDAPCGKSCTQVSCVDNHGTSRPFRQQCNSPM
jgi:hypothetical protein